MSMDDTIGELSRGSILIEGERIVAVAPTIEASDAEKVVHHAAPTGDGRERGSTGKRS